MEPTIIFENTEYQSDPQTDSQSTPPIQLFETDETQNYSNTTVPVIFEESSAVKEEQNIAGDLAAYLTSEHTYTPLDIEREAIEELINSGDDGDNGSDFGSPPIDGRGGDTPSDLHPTNLFLASIKALVPEEQYKILPPRTN